MKTIGDKIQDKALNKIGEKSLFTKGILRKNQYILMIKRTIIYMNINNIYFVPFCALDFIQFYPPIYEFSELEIGLANHDVDLVVHSLKDLPSTLPEDMVIGAIMERVDPRDTVIMKKGLRYSRLSNQREIKLPETLSDLPEGSVLGTSAVRRGAQLRAAYPNLGITHILFQA